MKQFITFFLFIILQISFVQAQTFPPISPKAEISIITGSPGTPLYAAFGHTAVRVKDPEKNLDILFNYGIFDFNTPNFYLKFARGKLKYVVEVFQYKSLYNTYKKEKRQMYEQVLNLSEQQKKQLYKNLLEDIKPENKYYQYDFFFDNCSTRVRDLLNRTFGNKLKWKYENFKKGQTFRELIYPYLKEKVWINLGLNLLLAQPTDKVASSEEYLFLPDYLFTTLKTSKLKEKKIVKKTNILLEKPVSSNKSSQFYFLTWLISSMVFLVGIFFTIKEVIKREEINLIDNIWLFTTGSLGIFLLLLWFGTEHRALPYNWNILWANPFNLLILFIRKNWIKWYFILIASINMMVLIFWAWLPQKFPLVLIPFIILITLRSFKKYYLLSIK